MKTLFASALAALSVLISTGVFAGTYIGLNNPGAYPQRWTCAGESFSADGSTVAGTCVNVIPGHVRYQQPAAYEYATTWDAATGAVTLGALTCYSPAHMGVDHSGCPTIVSLLDTNEVIVLDGVPFWYVTTSAAGAILLHRQTGSLIWYP